MSILRFKDENGEWLNVPSIVGPPGPSGQITAATAEIASGTVPDVEVQLGGTPEARTMHFVFSGIQGGGGSEASITAYTVTLLASAWTDALTQTVPVATATSLATTVIMVKPRDGAKDWLYGIQAAEQGAGTVTFTADRLPAEDLTYDITVIDANAVYVDAVAMHNADPAAHQVIELDFTGGE